MRRLQELLLIIPAGALLTIPTYDTLTNAVLALVVATIALIIVLSIADD